MIRLTVLLILMVGCEGVVLDAHALASRSGLDPDVAENIEIGLNCVLFTSCTILAALTVRFMNQVKLNKQIILSFFFCSWRNSIYGKTHRILTRLSNAQKPGKESGPFCFYVAASYPI